MFVQTAGRAGRKLDDVRDKYQKACRKLHLAHNEYVLLIHEATEVEKDYRTILLPSLLENHQTQQENFITIWWASVINLKKESWLSSKRWHQKFNRPSIESIRNLNPRILQEKLTRWGFKFWRSNVRQIRWDPEKNWLKSASSESFWWVSRLHWETQVCIELMTLWIIR